MDAGINTAALFSFFCLFDNVLSPKGQDIFESVVRINNILRLPDVDFKTSGVVVHTYCFYSPVLHCESSERNTGIRRVRSTQKSGFCGIVNDIGAEANRGVGSANVKRV